ncbi:polar amino acid transport system substrate-binding protein [Mycolicibacterium fluoranthenivorans]|uniref:Polar amino acid transport system substrate-binding protein n=2 Tax=Mycolicibacterium fluoranthenivorans TaxID=258505 RepID=A0A1G4WBH6_9MYCO|nr:glutamate ABC transporter substrate-binding protein [Mycolicibacterium fluoranthenivorans]SCX19917.1 polar amino acid transport system substrate-binding protein [Mycolicibacterium fluoranthenivorans]
MRARIIMALAVIGLAAGCGSVSEPVSVSVAPVEARPAGVTEVSTAPAAAGADCDKEASLRPGREPRPGAMPPGSTMAAIAARGRLIAGVDQNQYLFGFRNPATGALEGFDVDIARQIAGAIFGDPNRVEFRVVEAGQREAVLQSGEVDVVVRTFSINCARKQKVAFSTVYFNADQRILVRKDSGIDSAAGLAGKRACAVSGTTSLAKLYGLDPRPAVIGAPTWTDCLVMLQQGQVDAIGTDGVVLAGLAAQDPNVEVVGASLGVEPYGVGIKKENEDLVRFVNGMLERIRTDGTWQRLYDERLQPLGPSPGPPPARYQD